MCHMSNTGVDAQDAEAPQLEFRMNEHRFKASTWT